VRQHNGPKSHATNHKGTAWRGDTSAEFPGVYNFHGKFLTIPEIAWNISMTIPEKIFKQLGP